MKKIEPEHEILKSQEFQKDRYKFALILKNLSSPDLELYSDEESYIFCRGNKQWPVWIWTKDNFDAEKIKEIEEGICRYLIEGQKVKFTCKKEIYDLLAARKFCKICSKNCFEMGFLLCEKTKKPRQCDGKFDVAQESDRETLAEYWYDDCQEMNDVEPISMEKAQEDIDFFLESNSLCVLRNSENKIVCMASYSIIEEQAKIAAVYTPPDERKKGYAANLIYHITSRLLEKGYIPMLYTDYHYAPSNKAYQNAGYADQGILINFYCAENILF